MNNIILFTTMVSVSLDSFFCGLSMSLKTNKFLTFTLGIILSVFTLCLIGSFIGITLGNLLVSVSQIISGVILIIIAICGFFNDNTTKKMLTSYQDTFSTFNESILVGIAIGIDGAVGSFSLSLIYERGIIIPLIITALHVFLIDLSIIITNNKIVKKLSKYEYIPQIILLLLGVYKILTYII